MKNTTVPENRLVLASSSPTRKKVLAKLQVPFEIFTPNVDESHHLGESACDLVERLSIAKAKAAANAFQIHLIIGSDQVAEVDGEILGKPRDRDHAILQLSLMSGKVVILHTGLALFNSQSGTLQSAVLPYRVGFRKLTRTLIENYVDQDQPYDCGGSLRSEGLGIVLLTRFDGPDPNTLLGLPLIRLIDMLSNENYQVLQK